MYAITVYVRIAFNLIGSGNDNISPANNDRNNNKCHCHPREEEGLRGGTHRNEH